MPRLRRSRSLALTGALSLVTLSTVGAAVATAATGSKDPAGNNGTVKIAPYGPMDDIPRNHPHQGCTFQVEWYGFDAGGVVSDVHFQMQAPTSDVVLGGTEPSQVTLEDDAAGGAHLDPDGSQAYTLTFDGEPHPVQGFHVKLTIHTEGSIGADTKHKVFWVSGCDDEQPGEETSTLPTDDTTTLPTDETSTLPTDEGSTEPTGTDTTGTDTTETAGEQASVTPSPSDEGASDDAGASDDTEVAGEQAQQAGGQVPTEVAAGEAGVVAQLTGLPVGLLVAGAGALLGLGALLVRWRRA